MKYTMAFPDLFNIRLTFSGTAQTQNREHLHKHFLTLKGSWQLALTPHVKIIHAIIHAYLCSAVQ